MQHFVLAMLTVVAMFAGSIGIARGKGYPEPMEFVEVDGAAVEMGELESFAGDDNIPEDEVTVRSNGDRTDRWISRVGVPSVTLYMPKEKPTAAVLICPGGGLQGLAFDKEGCFIAEWFRDRGVAAGVMKYRVRHEGNADDYNARTVLDDVRSGLRMLREQTKIAGDDPRKVGLMGFSAGGYAAALGANSFGQGEADASSSEEAGVDFLVLAYAVLTLDDQVSHGGTHRAAINGLAGGTNADDFSPDKTINEKTPPTFLVHAADDRGVPVENAFRFLKGCQAKSIPCELHVYPKGGHGFGMWVDKGTLANWPDALEAWLKVQGVTQ